jgi:hypothetical protein
MDERAWEGIAQLGKHIDRRPGSKASLEEKKLIKDQILS